jgi:RHS repeat-associated protein
VGSGVERGNKFFELANHLGNVLATVSDKKRAVQNGTRGIVSHFVAEVVTAQDYYSFGWTMPGRKFSAGSGSSYRYGFNGIEKDDDISGEDVAYTTEFRIFDARIGRWFSVDPEEGNTISESPYTNNGNNPIVLKDPRGDDPISGILDAIVAFALSAGQDYVSARISGMDHTDAMDGVGWWVALWDGTKAYFSATIKPPGVGIAQQLYKFSKTKVGQILTGTVSRIADKVFANLDHGAYDDEDGDFDLDKLFNRAELTNLLLSSFQEELEAQATAAIQSMVQKKFAVMNGGVPADGGGGGIAGDKKKKADSDDNYKKKNITVDHANRKRAKEAGEHPHPGKKLPTPKKNAPKKKRDDYNEQQKYKKPEKHSNSKHPERHFHDRNKSKQKRRAKPNRHHTY